MTDELSIGPDDAMLDNVALSRKEGWFAFVETPPPPAPEPLTRSQLKKLGNDSLADYNTRRRRWHANLGPIRTPQLAELHEQLWDITDSNCQTGDKPKSAVAIDGSPGLGKTTAALAFGRDFHRREIAENGRKTAHGHQRIPVCRVGLTSNTGIVDFNRSMLGFFGHPGVNRGTAAQMAHRALDSALACETRMLMIDDLHFLRWGNRLGVEVSNYFKHIANEFPVTIVYIGVGLTKRGLLAEESLKGDTALAQTGRRTTKLGIDEFKIETNAGRKQWRQLLLTLEKKIVLADSHPGMLADHLSDYLYIRSSGYIGSLMALLQRGCQRAVRTGAEHLSKDLLDKIKNDAASEKTSKELAARFRAGKLTTRVDKENS